MYLGGGGTGDPLLGTTFVAKIIHLGRGELPTFTKEELYLPYSFFPQHTVHNLT